MGLRDTRGDDPSLWRGRCGEARVATRVAAWIDSGGRQHVGAPPDRVADELRKPDDKTQARADSFSKVWDPRIAPAAGAPPAALRSDYRGFGVWSEARATISRAGWRGEDPDSGGWTWPFRARPMGLAPRPHLWHRMLRMVAPDPAPPTSFWDDVGAHFPVAQGRALHRLLLRLRAVALRDVPPAAPGPRRLQDRPLGRGEEHRDPPVGGRPRRAPRRHRRLDRRRAGGAARS